MPCTLGTKATFGPSPEEPPDPLSFFLLQPASVSDADTATATAAAAPREIRILPLLPCGRPQAGPGVSSGEFSPLFGRAGVGPTHGNAHRPPLADQFVVG